MRNETLKVIRHRRSIRNYQEKPVKHEDLEAILQAAIYAPTAMNMQAWHFSVVSSPELLATIRSTHKQNMLRSDNPAMVKRAADPTFVPYYNAPVVIFISAVAESRFAMIDSGIAAENIALAAESLGLGSCIMTSSANLFLTDDDRSLRRAIGIPDGYEHVCSVLVGYKAEDPAAAERKADLVNYVE